MNLINTATGRWIALLLLTLATVMFSVTLRNPYPASMLALGIAFIKGRLVIEHFMEMAGVTDRISRIIHRIALTWLAGVIGLIAVAYWIGATHP